MGCCMLGQSSDTKKAQGEAMKKPAVVSVRRSFVRTFGEEQAEKIEAAAAEHKNGVHDKTGSDPFKWAIVICIGFECFTKKDYRSHHGITAPVEKIKGWIKRSGHLDTHDGDIDYLALFTGAYNEYIPKKKRKKP